MPRWSHPPVEESCLGRGGRLASLVNALDRLWDASLGQHAPPGRAYCGATVGPTEQTRATNVAALQHFLPQEARALQQTPPDVLAWLASQVGPEAHLAKQKSAPALHPCRPCAAPSVLQPSCIQAAPDLDPSPGRRQRATNQTAFTVAMPGSAGGRSALAPHDSSEEEDDAFDEDDPPGGVGGVGGGGGGGGGGSAGLLRAAEAAHRSSISGSSGAAEPAQHRLQRFLDTIAIQLHGEGGSAAPGAAAAGGKSPAVTVTTIHSGHSSQLCTVSCAQVRHTH